MKNPIKFIQEVKQEAFKVSWPTGKETVQGALMVFAMAVIMSIFFLDRFSKYKIINQVNDNSVYINDFINLNLVAIPRVTYDIRSNIALELSLSYSFMEFQNSRHTQADPSLPTNGQTNVYNETTPFPRVFSLRLGGIVRF